MDWILDFLDTDSGCFQHDQEYCFLYCSRVRLDLDCIFAEKNVTGCLLDLYLPGLKQESDCLNLVGTGSGLDLVSKFAKQDWTRTQKNHSPNTSVLHTRYTAYQQLNKAIRSNAQYNIECCLDIIELVICSNLIHLLNNLVFHNCEVFISQ